MDSVLICDEGCAYMCLFSNSGNIMIVGSLVNGSYLSSPIKNVILNISDYDNITYDTKAYNNIELKVEIVSDNSICLRMNVKNSANEYVEFSVSVQTLFDIARLVL